MSDRRAWIDWARGIAVLLMIEAHTADAWTRFADRGSKPFGWLILIGGFAAPLFLWLAGLGTAISAGRTLARSGCRRTAAAAACRRGLEIFLLAFLFRLQAFVVSPGSHPVTLFRVDILNVMGPAIAAAGLLWAAARQRWARIALLATATATIAMATPIVRASVAVDLLPTWVQWYLRPSGEYTTFTLLPWAGFVLAGAAAGVLVSDASRSEPEWSATAILGVSGGVLVVFGLYAASLPSIYAASSFWTSSPTWFAIRTGIVMGGVCLLAAVQGAARRPSLAPLFGVIARFGRASLFVYWIHVELVYGYASWLWRERLPVWATLVGFSLFSSLMYAAVVARDRYRMRKSIGFPQRVAVPQA